MRNGGRTMAAVAGEKDGDTDCLQRREKRRKEKKAMKV
jgi:hypothetical protein